MPRSSMSAKGDAVRLKHMLDAARKAVDVCRGGRAELVANELRLLAVTRLI